MTFNIPDRYPLILNIMLAALVIPYFAARSVSDMIRMHYSASAIPAVVENTAPRGPAFTGARPRGVYNLIVERDVFNLTPAAVDTAPVEKENLDITLIGTSHLTGGGPAFVIIQDQSGVQQLYRVGQVIPGAGKLLQVGQNRAIIEHNGHHVALDIPRDSLGQADSSDEGQPGTPPTRFRPHPLRRPFIRNPMVRPRPPNAKAGGIRKLAPKPICDRSLDYEQQRTEHDATLHPDTRSAEPEEWRIDGISPKRDSAWLDFSANGPARRRRADDGFRTADTRSGAGPADAFDSSNQIQHYAESAAQRRSTAT